MQELRCSGVRKKIAGFSEAEPWITVNDNYKTINAEASVKDPKSVFFYYKKLVQLRHEVPVITDGVYKLLDADNEKGIYLSPKKLKMRHYWSSVILQKRPSFIRWEIL